MGWVEKRAREEMEFRGFSKHTIKTYLKTARELDSLIALTSGDLFAALDAFSEIRPIKGIEKSALSFIKKEILVNFNRKGAP